MITMQNLVAVSHALCLHVRSQKIWGCCGPHTLIWWTSLTLETCYSPMCITIPDFFSSRPNRICSRKVSRKFSGHWSPAFCDGAWLT